MSAGQATPKRPPRAGQAPPRPAAAAREAARVLLTGVRPTREGAVYLWATAIFALAALLLGDNLVFLMGCLVLSAAPVAWLATRRNVRDLEIERHVPDRTQVGRPTPITWAVRNLRPRGPATGIEVRERALRAARPRQVIVEAETVPAGGRHQAATEVIFQRRGALWLAGPTVTSRFPLGLFEATGTAALRQRVLVRAAEGRITERLRGLLLGPSTRESPRTWTQRGEDTIYGVREYREGDDPRRIHWRTTARRGELILSQWRAEAGREVLVVFGRPKAGPRGGAAFERAVSAAATIWRAACRERLATRLVLDASRRNPHSLGGRGVDAGLDALALLMRTRKRRPRAALARLPGTRTGRTVIYVTYGPEPGVETALRAAAGRGGRVVLLRADRADLQQWVRGLGGPGRGAGRRVADGECGSS